MILGGRLVIIITAASGLPETSLGMIDASVMRIPDTVALESRLREVHESSLAGTPGADGILAPLSGEGSEEEAAGDRVDGGIVREASL